ncbi:MAG: YncE family protein, partial [Planctomycetota bacterium]
TPHGDRALVSCAQGAALAVIDARTHQVLQRIPMQLEAVEGSKDRLFGDRFGKSPVPIGIAVPPSGKVAYVANSGADRIAVVDLEQGRVVKTIPAGKEPDGIAWIPTP